jgi:hypothetical protein
MIPNNMSTSPIAFMIMSKGMYPFLYQSIWRVYSLLPSYSYSEVNAALPVTPSGPYEGNPADIVIPYSQCYPSIYSVLSSEGEVQGTRAASRSPAMWFAPKTWKC